MKISSLFFLFLLVTSCWFSEVDGVKKTKKQKKKASKTKKKDTNDEIKVTYANEEEKERKIRELREKFNTEDQPDPVEQKKKNDALVAAEEGLRKNVYRAILNHGEFSKEKANALHILGRNVYQQGKFEEVVTIATDILKIHETLDGPEALITAEALGNVASVSFRLGRKKPCELAMDRALHIMIQQYGAQSKEVLLHRGKMLTFQIANADNQERTGMSYDAYLEYLEDNDDDNEL
jgi:hypothetical protein